MGLFASKHNLPCISQAPVESVPLEHLAGAGSPINPSEFFSADVILEVEVESFPSLNGTFSSSCGWCDEFTEALNWVLHSSGSLSAIGGVHCFPVGGHWIRVAHLPIEHFLLDE
jgi:hypothetical protein